MLHFGATPPFSPARFLKMCRQYLPEKDCEVLESLPMPKDYDSARIKIPAINKWVLTDTVLRNELAKLRASRKHTNPDKYLRPDGEGMAAMHVVLAAHRAVSVLDGEKILDEYRWKSLDEIETGNFFNLNFLISYAYKLMILERWENVRIADKAALLEKAFQNN